jgi:Holliday junction resolvase RusA-like endonuclease
VRIACFRAYANAGIYAAGLPVFRAGVPVIIERCTFYVRTDQCRAADTDEPTGKPDLDKLLRALLDALGGAKRQREHGRLFADDSQVTEIHQLSKVRMTSGKSGAFIVVSDGRD